MARPIIGIAGSVRMMPLKAEGLSKAEKHGKRLDASSQSRKINDLEPISTTGLNLKELHEKHMAQADKVRKGDIKAFHLLIQFPQYLVEDKSLEWKLENARAFAARVFGDMAVFADRLDVDEKNQDVVDVFVAPLYLKKTKHTEGLAFTTTKHLTALAEKHEKSQTPKGKGQALQDELFEFFKDIGLENAKRGARKERPGKDWKASEELRAAELDKIEAQQFGQENVLLARKLELDGQEKYLKEQTERLKIAEDSLKSRVDKVAERQREMDDREADLNRRDHACNKRLAEIEAANELVEEGYREMDAARQLLSVEIEQEKQAMRAVETAEIQEKRRKADEEIGRGYDALRAAKEAFEEDAKRKKEAGDHDLAARKAALAQRVEEIANQGNIAREAHSRRERELNAREHVVRQREDAVNVKEKALEAGFNAIETGEIIGAGYLRDGSKGFRYGRETIKERQTQIWNSVQPAFEVVWRAAHAMYLAVVRAQQEAAENASEAIRGEIKAVRSVVARMAAFTRTAEDRAALRASGLEPSFEALKQIDTKDSEGISVADQLAWMKSSMLGR